MHKDYLEINENKCIAVSEDSEITLISKGNNLYSFSDIFEAEKTLGEDELEQLLELVDFREYKNKEEIRTILSQIIFESSRNSSMNLKRTNPNGVDK